jgi:hypothetical protein
MFEYKKKVGYLLYVQKVNRQVDEIQERRYQGEALYLFIRAMSLRGRDKGEDHHPFQGDWRVTGTDDIKG